MNLKTALIVTVVVCFCTFGTTPAARPATPGAEALTGVGTATKPTLALPASGEGGGSGLPLLSKERVGVRYGVPNAVPMHFMPAVWSAPYFTRGVSGPYLSLLDNSGRLAYAIPMRQILLWKTELKKASPSPARAARLHIWLGEWELANNQQPEKAMWHFRQAQQIVKSEEPANGLALYDSAIALYFAGAYADAGAAFRALMATKTPLYGFDGRTCTLWMRQSEACASYHDEHARIGIPEPTRLDPMCAAAALAAALRSLDLPYDRVTLLHACRVTGEGSSLQDVLDAAPKLGVVARAVHSDDEGLIALPKPLVAYVEHDHFIAVTRADKAGVGYLCSDCGAWPGGQVNLTWKQWHTMAAGTYAVITRPRSQWDKTLAAALCGITPVRGGPAALDKTGGEPEPPIQFASIGDISAIAGSRLDFAGAAAVISHHVYRAIAPAAAGVVCGSKQGATHPLPWRHSPMDGEPVDLATGEENYASPPDMVVHNPYGPDVVWSRNYDSLRAVEEPGYNSNDYGVGWSNSYNSAVYTTSAMSISSYNSLPYFQGNVMLVLPNGSTVLATPNGSFTYMPASNTYEQQYSVPNGAPLTITYFPYIGFVVVLKDRTTLTYAAPNAGAVTSVNLPAGQYFPLTSLSDSNGNTLNFNYTFDPITFTTDPSVHSPNPVASPLFNPTYQICNDNGSGCFPVVAGNYAAPEVGPLLSSITVGAPPNPNGQPFTMPAACTPSISSDCYPALLTITRNIPTGSIDWEDWEQYFNIQQITDWNGRSVYYTEDAIPNVFPPGDPSIPSSGDPSSGGIMATMQELDHVSELQPADLTACSNLPDQYVYGYVPVCNTGGNATACGGTGETVPFLSTVTSPSPVGKSQMSTLTFQYGAYNGTYETGSGVTWTGGVDYDTVTSMIDAEGNTHKYTEGSPSEPSDTLFTTVTTEDASGNPVYTHTVGFDTSGDWTSDTDNAGNTTFQATYDPTSADIYDPTMVQDGNELNNVPGDSGEQWTANWDIFGNLLSMTTPNGVKTTYTYTAASDPTVTNPYPSIPIYAPGGAPVNYVMGELTEVQTSYGGDQLPPVNFDYYEASTASSPTDPPGYIKDIYYPSPSGNADQAAISYTYDVVGDLASVTSPGDDGATAITTTVNQSTETAPWTGNGNPVSVPLKGEPASITDNLGHTVASYSYDQDNIASQYSYSKPMGYLTDATDAEGNTTHVEPDIFGNPLSIVLGKTLSTPNGLSEILYDYAYTGGPANGYSVSAWNGGGWQPVPNGQGSVQYGPSGEVLSAVDGTGAPVQYEYDAAYRLKAITDGSGNTTSFGYVGGQASGQNAGYLSAISDPGLNRYEQFGPYDYDGNLLTYSDQALTVQNYQYDPDGDLTSDNFVYSSVPNYAALSVDPINYDAFDRVTGYSAGSETVTYGFTSSPSNANSYINSVTRQYTNGPSAKVSYTYYDDFNRNTMTAGPLGTFTYGHDADGNTTSVTDPSGASAGYQWSADGLLQQSSHVSGDATVDTTSYSYNPLDLLTDAKTVAGTGGGVLADFGGSTASSEIQYDGLGNTLSVSSSVDGTAGTSSYGYDGQSQLTSESTTFGGASANPGFSYDNAGNATEVRTYDTSFNAANEDASVQFGPTGAPLTVEGQSAGYDALDHLTSIGSETNTYTADGLLGSTTAGGSST